MHNFNPSRKLFLAIGIIFVILIGTVALILINKSNNLETVVKDILNKTYSAKPEDYDNLNTAITQSSENSNPLLVYLHIIYGDQLTENGYKVLINNRIPSRAANIAHDENSDLKVTSINLEQEDANTGSKRYRFSVQVKTVMDITHVFKGDIIAIKENGHWKVDGISPIN